MNVYLDIDGVLVANERFAANGAEEFLDYVLGRFPDTTYWLTTHCQGDANLPIKHIGHLFNTKTVELMRKIKPTTWKIAKTEAINFSQPFLWFDDDLFDDERHELIEHNVLDSWVGVDLAKDQDALKKFIGNFPV